MKEIVLKGHKVAKGKTKGEALVSHEPISFVIGVDSEAGVVVEKGHELEGVSFAGKILVFPVGKGSTGASFALYDTVVNKKAPKGLINLRADPVLTAGAIISDIPFIDRLNGDPITLIRTGDYVEMDADKGIVRIRQR